VGDDETGLEGLELEHDDLLAGRDGSVLLEQDPSGNAIPQGMRRTLDPVAGDDLVLSIDGDLQFQAQRALAAAVRSNDARGGMAIVMDPRTGEILAMATDPGFDANRFAETSLERRRNRAVTDVYEPGSVNKVITASAAIQEHAVGLRQTFTVPDRYRVSDEVFNDAHRHPPMTMTLTDIIADSSNVGTIMTAQRVGKRTLDRYLRRFGFGEPTGVGFPGEAAGILPEAEAWWGSSMGTIPIGQGVAVTPLQMTAVYATIANRGVWVRPTLVRGTLGPDGDVIPFGERERQRIVSRRTARAVTGMLARAVESGTGEAAQIGGYWVAGKTGTARKPLEGGLGYSDRYVASFMGFLPASRPQLVVAAILDEPITVYGGVASAPLFREIARFAIAHLRIPPGERPWIPPVAGERGR
ncbi:MAG TPA: penicillin-binding protein 2, partial [Actinomycetota bacterium]|nr:penicillin-binding protein 2 [Actinomycetota bacterium]